MQLQTETVLLLGTHSTSCCRCSSGQSGIHHRNPKLPEAHSLTHLPFFMQPLATHCFFMIPVSFSPATSPCFLQLTSLFRVTCQPCTCCMVFSSLSLKCGICNFALPQHLTQQCCADSLTALSRRWYHCKKKPFHPVQNTMLNQMKCRGILSREQCSVHTEKEIGHSPEGKLNSVRLNLFLRYVLQSPNWIWKLYFVSFVALIY